MYCRTEERRNRYLWNEIFFYSSRCRLRRLGRRGYKRLRKTEKSPILFVLSGCVLASLTVAMCACEVSVENLTVVLTLSSRPTPGAALIWLSIHEAGNAHSHSSTDGVPCLPHIHLSGSTVTSKRLCYWWT